MQRPNYALPIDTGAHLIEIGLLTLQLRMADACDIDALAQLRWNLCADDQVSDINDQCRQVHLVAELNDMIICVSKFLISPD